MLTPKRLFALFSYRALTKRSVDIRYALIEACIIGAFSALAALLLRAGIGWLGGWRVHAANTLGDRLVFPIGGLGLGLLGGWLIEQLAPEASGGGIPQVKAALARFPMALSLRIAAVKLLSTILVLGSGLTLGSRAPTVHIGAALAAQLSRWVPTSPEHRRQMIAAGAAAGLAAGFNTPIAGVLFVIEELMRDASSLTLETAILASFVGAVVSRRLSGAADLNITVSLFDSSIQRGFSAPEIPFYLLLGVLAGLLGAFFNRGMLLSISLYRRFRLSMAWRVGLAGLISGLTIASLPPLFRDYAGLRDYLIAGAENWEITAIAFVAHFFLTLLASSSGAPGGLFAPALVLGSALGYLVGIAQELTWGLNSPNTYAFAGMGAFFTGVIRVPVTAIVIVFEMTTDFNVVLPLMISSAVAYVVGESVFRGSLYDHLLQASGIILDDRAPTRSDFLTQLKAADVMQYPVETLESNLTLEQVLQIMSRSHHRGFPVVEEGCLVGIVTQGDFSKLSTQSGQTHLKEVMTPRPITVKPTASLSDVLYLLNHYQISRLPVVEGSKKLVGMITRSDIIRAEANQLSGEAIAPPTPSYLVYQTRAPAIGRGRILLPIANPETAPELMQMAAALAAYQRYELEALQVILVPKHRLPAETSVDVSAGRQLMERVEQLADDWKIPVHTQICVAQDTAEAILETIAHRHINLVLMGWKGRTYTSGAIFGGVVDTLIHKAPCELMLVKLGQLPLAYPRSLDREASWLIPMAGGPNAQRALELLPALTDPYPTPHSPRIVLCQVHPPESVPNNEALEKAASSIRDKLELPVLTVPIRSYSVADAVIHLANERHCSAVMLGVSREGLLTQAVRGNIPEAIARGVDSTVILVRGTMG